MDCLVHRINPRQDLTLALALLALEQVHLVPQPEQLGACLVLNPRRLVLEQPLVPMLVQECLVPQEPLEQDWAQVP